MKTPLIPKQCARIVVHFTCVRVSNSRQAPSGSVCTSLPCLDPRIHSTVSSVGRVCGAGVGVVGGEGFYNGIKNGCE